MNAIPDMSYFAVPGFIEEMRKRPVATASLILHNGNPRARQWDETLKDSSGGLYNSLHSMTKNCHDIYFPFLENKSFLAHNAEYMQEFIAPVKGRIMSFLEARFGDPELISQPITDWIEYLYADEVKHYKAAEMGADVFNVQLSDLPCIILWADLDNDSLIKILPYSYDNTLQIKNYIKGIYSGITSIKREQKNHKPSISRILRDLNREFDQPRGVKGSSGSIEIKVRRISCEKIQRSVARSLREIGVCYKDYYDDAILAFEDKMKSITPSKYFVMYFTEKKKQIIRKLKEYGFLLDRNDGDHEIWQHPMLKKPTPVPKHNKISRNVWESIMDDIRAAIAATANEI